MTIRIKKKSLSGNVWLKRQLNDQYVKQAHLHGYRSRAAFKLLEIDKKFSLLKKAKPILDLGCAPGSWLQVISQYPNKNIYGVDLLEIDYIADVTFTQGDFTNPLVQQLLPESVDLILSDIAPNTTGHQSTDHLRIMAILDEVLAFSDSHLTYGGSLVMKIFQGSEFNSFIKKLRQKFQAVHIFKPESSRKESSEIYLICLSKA